MRIALGVEYDGSAFNGWQTQGDVPTVQEHLERALSKVADHTIGVVCAGRTDTGVHALEQVVHFDTDAQRSMRSWVLGANVNLPKTVAVLWATPVSDAFHARFSAQARRYRYVILNRWVRPSVLSGRVSWVHTELDAKAMQAGAAHLIGEHDFTSFRAVACQANHPVREIRELSVERRGEFIIIEVEANAFLHHMVRNIAGSLIRVGRGEAAPDWIFEVLVQRDRRLAGVTAPPDGLYLVGVRYPSEFTLPNAHVQARFVGF